MSILDSFDNSKAKCERCKKYFHISENLKYETLFTLKCKTTIPSFLLLMDKKPYWCRECMDYLAESLANLSKNEQTK